MKKKIIVLTILFAAALSSALVFSKRQNFAYSGIVEAVETDISPKVSDTIIKFYVKEGDEIKKGEMLFELEGKDILAAYNYAKTEFERISEIYKRNAVSKENYDAKKYAYDLSLIKKDNLTVKSPKDAKVLYKYYNESEFAQAGKKVLTIADLKEVDVWVYLPHDEIAKIKIGDKVSGYLPETARNYEGFINVINDTAEFTPKNVQTRDERQRLVYGVKIRFKNDESLTLKPGMTLELKF